VTDLGYRADHVEVRYHCV